MTDTKPTPAAKSEKPTAPAADKTSTNGATEKPDTAKDSAKSYSRGEGQKPVSPRYRSNWDTVFGKKKR